MIIKPTDTDIARYGRREFLALSALAGAYAACNSPTAPSEPFDLHVYVADRISGANANGSDFTINCPDGSSYKQPVVDGACVFKDFVPQAGNITIEGNHLPHKTDEADISGDLRLSVIGWDSTCPEIPGTAYSREFDPFFNETARLDTYRQIDWVKKWLTMPAKIYVTKENMSDLSFERFLNILDSVNEESIPDMFGRKVRKLPVEIGPPMDKYPDGIFDIRFKQFAPAPNGGIIGGTGATFLNGQTIVRAEPVFNSEYFQRYPSDYQIRQWKMITAHELYHGAFANHSTIQLFSLMRPTGGINPGLENVDKLAAMIVYHENTHTGNKYPDTNASYVVKSSRELGGACQAVIKNGELHYEKMSQPLAEQLYREFVTTNQ